MVDLVIGQARPLGRFEEHRGDVPLAEDNILRKNVR